MMATKNTSLIVYRACDVKFWRQDRRRLRKRDRDSARDAPPRGRPLGGPLGLHGHGLRDRQVRGSLEITAPSTTSVIACRRYRCVGCGAVITVVPRGIEPRRHSGRAAICLALALWALGGQPTTAVRVRVGAWPSREATSWRVLRRWSAAIASGAWSWCATAAGLATRAAAARAAQIAAGSAPTSTTAPVWELAYAGGAALA
jgi:hypothetical protein